MNLGINLDGTGAKYPRNRLIEIIKDNKFTHVFLDSIHTENGVDRYDEAVTDLQSAGLIIDFCHAPFRGINAIYKDNLDGTAYYEMLWQNIDRCAKYNIPGIIMHLSSGDVPPIMGELGFSRFKGLFSHGQDVGVKIHFENIRTLANLATIFENIPEAGFCWDVGHEACFAWGRQYMPLFGSRLSALHLHDNHGEHNGDEHMIPYDGTLDYDRIARQIAESPFDGTIMLEVFDSSYNLTPEEFFARAGLAAARVRDAVKAYRSR